MTEKENKTCNKPGCSLSPHGGNFCSIDHMFEYFNNIDLEELTKTRDERYDYLKDKILDNLKEIAALKYPKANEFLKKYNIVCTLCPTILSPIAEYNTESFEAICYGPCSEIEVNEHHWREVFPIELKSQVKEADAQDYLLTRHGGCRHSTAGSCRED